MTERLPETLFLALALLAFYGCGKSPDAEAGMAQSPQQAASQMEQAFSSAADEKMKQLAVAASEALRNNEYEAAVVSLQTMRGQQQITPDQRLAIYGSALTLEARLISAMEAGDKNAERAYKLLKELKKN